jgi:hypothetical protein
VARGSGEGEGDGIRNKRVVGDSISEKENAESVAIRDEYYVCSERGIRERNSIGSCEKGYLRENERSLARVE